MSEEVTKSKNEGRVATGKKLTEWNKKQKENLFKNKEQVEPSDQQELQSHASSGISNTTIYGSGAIVLFTVIGVALYLLLPRRQPAPATPVPVVIKDDIFCMN